LLGVEPTPPTMAQLEFACFQWISAVFHYAVDASGILLAS
jgi:hypothetical protein